MILRSWRYIAFGFSYLNLSFSAGLYPFFSIRGVHIKFFINFVLLSIWSVRSGFSWVVVSGRTHNLHTRVYLFDISRVVWPTFHNWVCTFFLAVCPYLHSLSFSRICIVSFFSLHTQILFSICTLPLSRQLH